MPRAAVNGIELEYEVFGEGQPLLLIQGLNTQMILWDEDLCRSFVQEGFQVIRFDNRDSGLSTWIEAEVGDVRLAMLKAYLGIGRRVQAPYTLPDMADDCAGLLDHLGIERAAIFGVSMGGMIAQTMAIRHPDRVQALVSMMSTTGSKSVFPKFRALRGLFRAPPSDRQGHIDHVVKYFSTIRGSRFDPNEARLRFLSGQSHDRGIAPFGAKRQLMATLASGSRVKALQKLTVPALVLHGSEDPLVPVRGGVLTARAIPGAQLKVIDGLGHYLPPGAWPIIVSSIREFAGDLGLPLRTQ